MNCIIKKKDIEKAKELTMEVRQLMRERKAFIANQRLNEINDILMNAKEVEDGPTDTKTKSTD